MKPLLATAAVLALATFASQVQAAEDFKPKQKGHWIVNLRATVVAPTGKSSIDTAAGAPTGLDAKVSASAMPTAGFTYFFTDHVAVEAIVGTTPHTAKAVGGSTDVTVHDTWVLPPVVALQYHFLPRSRFSPYVGTGPNYMIFYGGEDKNGFKVRLKDDWGWAAQAGADYAISGPWSLNLDVKKIWMTTDAKIDGGVLKSKVRLDPWVPSIGLGYRF